MKRAIPYIIFFLISSLLTIVFTVKLINGNFLYIGDQFLRFNYFETFINSFFLRKPENFSVLNGWQFVTQFIDVLYFLIVYKLFSLPLQLVEKISYFLILFFTMSLSYIGIDRVNSLLKLSKSTVVIIVISLWYSFNPYTVILWHGGVYNLGSMLSYALAPLIFYYFHKVFFIKFNIREIMHLSLLVLLASFTFWLLAPFIFFLVFYSATYIIFNLNKAVLSNFLKSSFVFLMFYLPMASFIIFCILFEAFHSAGNNNATFTPTFTNQLGGIRAQVYMWFSWGIYTVWTPRGMFSFNNFYFSRWYLNATKLLYIIIGLGGVLKYHKKIFTVIKHLFKGEVKIPKITTVTKIFISFLVILCLALFFAKGSQPPYGGIFLFLYHNLPLFSVFRTPDIRFGFIVVFSIAILLLFISSQFNKYLLIGVLLIVIWLQSSIFFNGIAMYGQNIGNKYYDRIINIPPDYQHVADYINSDQRGYGYVLPIPSDPYVHFLIDGHHHFGQDILSKLIQDPFAYLSLSDGTFHKTYVALNNIIQKQEFKKIKLFPIKYIIARNDEICVPACKPPKDKLGAVFKNLLQNKSFTVYKVDNFTPIIKSENIKFSVINPVEYSVIFNHVKNKQDIHLLLSYNKDWKIFIQPDNIAYYCKSLVTYSKEREQECVVKQRFFEGNEIKYLWQKPIFDTTHRLGSDNYSNNWVINPKDIEKNYGSGYYTKNKDGSINFSATIYYQPQSWYYLMGLVSTISIISLLVYLIYKSKTDYRNYNG